MDNKKSACSRIDTLQQYYNTAYPNLSDTLALDRFMDRSWLDTERPMPECIHELHALAEMHTQNLHSLHTDEGVMYYLTHLDLPSAISVDLQARKEEKGTGQKVAEGLPSHPSHPNHPNFPNHPNNPPIHAMNENDKLERTFLVQCSKDQLIALGHYMTSQGIFFRKCSDGINTEAHAEIFPAAKETADGPFRPQ